jgi:pyridoxal phosphate enzyme (YggS family)
MGVTENIALIRETVDSYPVKLIAVTKEAESVQIEEAFNSGVTEFGENRVQDAIARMDALSPKIQAASNWHFIGHLQTNKAKLAVGRFALIHSVDSLRLATEISKQAEQKGFIQPILMQVKILPDPSKGGYAPDELRRDFPALLKLPNIECRGLMTITPLAATDRQKQQCFQGLAKLKDELSMTFGVPLKELSMGMSDDWREAVLCGSTMIRIGRAIFKQ